MGRAAGTTPALVRSCAERFGSREALVDGDVRLSFAELAHAVERAARALIASGVQRGDRISIWAPNSHEWVVAALAIHAAGGVLVPLNTRLRGGEACEVLARSRARMLLCVDRFLETDYVAMLRDACAHQLPDLEQIVLLRGEAREGALAWRELLSRADGVTPEQAERRAAEVGPDDIADVMFTSGTTGRAKGALFTHRQMLRTYATACEIVGLCSDDRYLIIPPFSHTFGYKFGFITALLAGATSLPVAVFDPADALARIERERITFLPGPPTLYQSILDHPERDRFDLSSLRVGFTGAAVVPAVMIERLHRELHFETLLTGYGLTESSGVATMCRRDDDVTTVAGTSGRAFPGVEVIVADEKGVELERGQQGEVLVRGFNVMRGYLDDPEQTAQALAPDGWLRTGDIGVMDASGYLRIVDRKKDMFIAGGFNAYPAEIERLLLAHEKIAQAAVVGTPDERLGEVGAAFLLLRPGQRVTAGEIIAWARSRMAGYKVPRYVELVDELPTNASGKVLKYVLRERARELAEAARARG